MNVRYVDRMRPLAVFVTGDPVPTAKAARGTFTEMIGRTLGDAWRGPVLEVECRATESLPAANDLAGIVITGSASSVTERAPWILDVEAYLRAAVAAETPILGICFGHQLLGQALGGLVEKNARGRQIGTLEASLLADDPLLDASLVPFVVNSTHRDIVTKLPPNARVVAETPLDPNAAVRFGKNVFGVQFHPEFDGETMRSYLLERREILREEGFDPEKLIAEANDAAPGASVLRRFARELELARDGY
jgi:GMP synthase (glutamine-hydrolysing)